MIIRNEIQEVGFGNLDFLAKQVVEGFISGMHKSPFHGFSAEFAEHKVYNNGESTKHIDWKLFAKTDKLYTKRYDDETNLRCHFVLDNSASMHFPEMKKQSIDSFNKLGFSTLAIAALMQFLKKQRDAVGLSVYDSDFSFYSPERGSSRHHAMLLNALDKTIETPAVEKTTKTFEALHEIAEKLHKRSMVVLFSDMFQTDKETEAIFEALKHLKYNKHEVILFHTLDYEREVDFDYDNRPMRYTDVETGKRIDIYADHAKLNYKEAMAAFINEIKNTCGQYRIQYFPVDINATFNQVLTHFLIQRQLFV